MQHESHTSSCVHCMRITPTPSQIRIVSPICIGSTGLCKWHQLVKRVPSCYDAWRCGTNSHGMQAAQRQGTVSQEIARQTDGVLLAVGALSSVLKKKVSPKPEVALLCHTTLLLLLKQQHLSLSQAAKLIACYLLSSAPTKGWLPVLVLSPRLQLSECAAQHLMARYLLACIAILGLCKLYKGF